eukprot:scaffold151536_cov31-Prasinocladus_malaysianus.AAC.2
MATNILHWVKFWQVASLSEALAMYKKSLTADEMSKEVEEEAATLPGATMQNHEILAAMGKLLQSGGPGLEADPKSAAELFREAAEAASASGKGKLAAKYYELHAAIEA